MTPDLIQVVDVLTKSVDAVIASITNEDYEPLPCLVQKALLL